MIVLSSDTETGAEEAAALSEPPEEATAIPMVEIMVPRALFMVVSRSRVRKMSFQVKMERRRCVCGRI